MLYLVKICSTGGNVKVGRQEKMVEIFYFVSLRTWPDLKFERDFETLTREGDSVV